MGMWTVFCVPLLAMCFLSWRSGILITVAVAFAQDPVRKMIPGEPGYMVLFFAPFLIITVIAAIREGVSLVPHKVLTTPGLQLAIYLYFVVIGIQMVVAYVVTSSFTVPILGAVAYIFPVLGLVFATSYASQRPHFVTLLHLYACIAFLFGIGVYLRAYGVDWDLVDSVGVGLFVYPESGGRLELPSGFFRSPEIAAWHCGMGAIVIATLLSARLWRLGTVVGVLMVFALVIAMLLTGRRKMIVVVSIWLVAYILFSVWKNRLSVQQTIGLLVAGGVLVAADEFMWTDFNAEMFNIYFERNTLAVDDLKDRVYNMVINSFQKAHERAGWFGLGAGTGSQDSQHLMNNRGLVGGSAEGGLSKIFIELGIHGCFAVVVFAAAVGRAIFVQFRFAGSDACQAPFTVVHFSILAAVIGNIASYAVASQVYGDPFVLFMLGIFSGLLLSATSYSVEPSRTDQVHYAGHDGVPA